MIRFFFSLFAFLIVLGIPLNGEVAAVKFDAFTGKITKNKVRLRILPDLDSKILKELNRDDLYIVVGEDNDFYAVQAPKGMKAFVFRTFVLDNVVESNHVNIRLEPNLEAPVVGQLNNGDLIDGKISPLNSKWLEFTPPSSVKFYVAKEYVENIGDPGMLARLQKRRQDAQDLLARTQEISENELKKPFHEIQLDPVYINVNTIIKSYADFPELVVRAKELQRAVHELYLEKKVAYLESKAKENGIKPVEKAPPNSILQITPSMAAWIPFEESIYQNWATKHPHVSQQDYYTKQKQDGEILSGIIQSYTYSFRHKPGDYMLITPNSHEPQAYLYSTQIDLQQYVGKQVTLIGSLRPNYNFAFPAYFIFSLDVHENY
jgi:hypothetical protein